MSLEGRIFGPPHAAALPAERDMAVRMLQEHHDAGRLTDAELEERSTSAIRAAEMHDLDFLFWDLPVLLGRPAAATGERMTAIGARRWLDEHYAAP